MCADVNGKATHVSKLPDDDDFTVIDDQDDEAVVEDEPGSIPPETLLFPQVSSPASDADRMGPSISQKLKLWQIFLDNFNPLVKLFHAPTVQLIVHQAVIDSGSLGKSQKALLRAIYQCAVITLSDEECVVQLNEPREILLGRYMIATQQALVRAEFLKSTDLISLQALTLYLVSVNILLEARD